MGLLIRGMVSHRVEIEDHDVSIITLTEQASVPDGEAVGYGRRHLSNGIFKRDYPMFPYVTPQDSGESSILAGVNQGSGPRWVGSAGVGSELDPWLTELELEILFSHHEVDSSDPLPFGKDQVEHGIDPILFQLCRYLGQSQASVFSVLWFLQAE